MLRRNSFLGASLRATALTTLLALAVASAAQAAATTTRRPTDARLRTLAMGGALVAGPAKAAGLTRSAGALATSVAPLNGPHGMKIDAAGNLWVANTGANQVLEYGSNLQQQTTNTIVAGISKPTDVALDSRGLLHVANSGSNSITVYNLALRTQLPTRTLTNAINNPRTIAIDGLDNIWVNNNLNALAIYATDNTLLQTYAETFLTSISIRGPYLSIGYAWSVYTLPAAGSIAHVATSFQNMNSYSNGTSGGVASCFDANGQLYVSDGYDQVHIFFDPTLAFENRSLKTTFAPFGVAVDVAHNHIFVGGATTNQIAVYNLQLKFIGTIH